MLWIALSFSIIMGSMGMLPENDLVSNWIINIFYGKVVSPPGGESA